MGPGFLLVVDDGKARQLGGMAALLILSGMATALPTQGEVLEARDSIAVQLAAFDDYKYKPRPLPDRSWSRKANWGKPWARGSRR